MTTITTLTCDRVLARIPGHPQVGTQVERCPKRIHVFGGTSGAAGRIARSLGWRVTLGSVICPDHRAPEDDR